MHETHIKKIKHANRSWAKQRPNTKYATLNTINNKSDIFVLRECSVSIIFIFGEEYK